MGSMITFCYLCTHKYEHDRSKLLVFPLAISRYKRDIRNIQRRQSSLYHLNAINVEFGHKL